MVLATLYLMEMIFAITIFVANPKPTETETEFSNLGKTVKNRNLKILQIDKPKKTETVLYFLEKTETGKFGNRASSSFHWKSIRFLIGMYEH